ncbi:putative poly(ADP-ribose) glycohydrolase [Leptomonas seymouri]|uniref:poly(ADP-ribose) glycohydrolase n=1 Tax=Leptomonas seymouri TaxID=5684 RepID=A0A0N0P928_LEPSE|nr:putative poly(ADP-ribose) glycohydrolase [Leptomonas seymouri]|eukprot:KPI90217.1 putative poly(ADP-ribose) glycohydrolase [Leptomonas seymouri]
MSKNRLQQQTLDRFFTPSTVHRPSLPSVCSTRPASREVLDVDAESATDVLNSGPSPLAPSTDRKASALQEKIWLLGRQQVVFPWSPLNTRIGANGETVYVWELIQHVLREPFRVSSSEDFCSLLVALDELVDGPGNSFEAFRRALGKMTADEQAHLFTDVLPWMKESVLRAPTIFDGKSVALLVQGETRRLVLSHEEIVALMCCCFFSLFPRRSEAANRGGGHASFGQERHGKTGPPTASHPFIHGPRGVQVSSKLPCCNFSSLFSCGTAGRDGSLDSKIRGFIEYFFCCHRHDAKPLSIAHQRCLELTRVFRTEFPAFEESTQPLSAVSMCRSGCIENDAASLQVDFANRFVGGGVLRSGCVQEEIRMTLAPEMVLSRLVCEELAESEVLLISGAPNFCEATGYAEKFQFMHGCDPWGSQAAQDSHSRFCHVPPLLPAQAKHPRTQKAMLIHNVCVLAMDAHSFRHCGGSANQYRLPYLRRELRKAYVGFHGVSDTFAVLPIVRTGSIASGHWGCGAFRGDKELKLLLQWCAAAEAGGRQLHYYTFDTPLKDFDALQEKIHLAAWTVGTLVKLLIQYDEYRCKLPEGEAVRVFEFVEQALASAPYQGVLCVSP